MYFLQDPKRPYFHPLKEHRTWCPWSKSSHQVNASDKSTDVNSSPIGQSMSPYRNGTNQEPGWKKVLLMLLPELSPNKSLADIARTVSLMAELYCINYDKLTFSRNNGSVQKKIICCVKCHSGNFIIEKKLYVHVTDILV